ncbi:MAG: histidine kinase N-terminal domain-containing protein [Chloroflexi bacterium]|nr:histidine kinase N-terminal domain-containing protein [Chloroflexota bacterium]
MVLAALDREIARQQSILDALPVLADLTRADVLYYDLSDSHHAIVALHAQPRTTSSLYRQNRKDDHITILSGTSLAKVIATGAHDEHSLISTVEGASVAHQELWPVFDPSSGIIGLVGIEMSDQEFKSTRNHDEVLRHALTVLKAMVVRGELAGAEELSAMAEQDGVVILDSDQRVRYASSTAAYLLGKLGVCSAERAVGQRLDVFESGDERLVGQAWRERRCISREGPVRDWLWLRTILPLNPESTALGRPRLRLGLPDILPPQRQAILIIRDVTAERSQEQEQVRLETMIKEIHHRVKNNLQTIISLANLQTRRAEAFETKRALKEITNRIFAVARVHEFLATVSPVSVQLKEISRQIAARVRDSLLAPDSRISIDVEGDAVRLAPRQATACALIINELVQNAVEHAFDADTTGYIRIQLEETDDCVRIRVVDNGRGLPANFQEQQTTRLGLRIVRMLVQDLRGEFTLTGSPALSHGLMAQVTLSKLLPGGH